MRVLRRPLQMGGERARASAYCGIRGIECRCGAGVGAGRPRV